MRKCHECGETKGLKQIMLESCDDDTHHHENNGYRGSICAGCFVICSCEEDFHDVDDCLQDPECPNHKQTKSYCENWHDYDYHWKLKPTKIMDGDAQ